MKRWFPLNDLLLNADKSDIAVVGTAQQLRSAAIPTTVDVAGCSMQVSTQIKSLGVVIDDHLLFDRHVSAVASACMYHARALRHVRGVLSTETVKTIACSIAASRLDYCNSLLPGAPTSTVDKLQRTQNVLARKGGSWRGGGQGGACPLKMLKSPFGLLHD